MDHIHQALAYDPSTGGFWWRTGRRAGKVAGCVTTTMQGRRYRLIKLGGELLYAHRIAWLYMTGAWPREYIDHVNGDGLDNSWANLREATRAENGHNSRLDKRSTTGVRGVYRDRHGTVFRESW